MSILLVEDDEHIRRTLRINLEARGYDVDEAQDGHEAVVAIATRAPDLVILDLGLPRMSGIDVLRTVRQAHATPVLVLSGRHDTAQKVEALDAGANDYVTKPFAVDELVARVRALLRTVGGGAGSSVAGRSSGSGSSGGAASDAYAIGSARVDLTTREASRGDAAIRLTPTEWAVLEVLLRNAGRLVSKRELLTAVWGPTSVREDGYLRLYLSQLRGKLEDDPTRPRHLLTEPGLGYRYRA